MSWLTDKSIPTRESNCPPIHIHVYINNTSVYTEIQEQQE